MMNCFLPRGINAFMIDAIENRFTTGRKGTDIVCGGFDPSCSKVDILLDGNAIMQIGFTDYEVTLLSINYLNQPSRECQSRINAVFAWNDFQAKIIIRKRIPYLTTLSPNGKIDGNFGDGTKIKIKSGWIDLIDVK